MTVNEKIERSMTQSQLAYLVLSIQAAAADERKACAKIAEQYDTEVADGIAREIRARGRKG